MFKKQYPLDQSAIYYAVNIPFLFITTYDEMSACMCMCALHYIYSAYHVYSLQKQRLSSHYCSVLTMQDLTTKGHINLLKLVSLNNVQPFLIKH